MIATQRRCPSVKTPETQEARKQRKMRKESAPETDRSICAFCVSSFALFVFHAIDILITDCQ
jgi:hypothetical protein